MPRSSHLIAIMACAVALTGAKTLEHEENLAQLDVARDAAFTAKRTQAVLADGTRARRAFSAAVEAHKTVTLGRISGRHYVFEIKFAPTPPPRFSDQCADVSVEVTGDTSSFPNGNWAPLLNWNAVASRARSHQLICRDSNGKTFWRAENKMKLDLG